MRHVLVLADSTDTVALNVAAALRRCGVPTLAIAPIELSLGCRWINNIVDGKMVSEIQVRNIALTDFDIGAVLNRLAMPRFFPSGIWKQPVDADYAEAEFAALVSSWLSELPALVVGRPTEGVLWADRHLFEWLMLGTAAGLPVRHIQESTDSRSLNAFGRVAYDPTGAPGVVAPIDVRVVGRNPLLLGDPVADCGRTYLVGAHVVGAPDYRLVPAVRRLGQLADAVLLECHFARRANTAGEWVLCGASAFPADAPPTVITAIADMLGHAADSAP